MTGAVETRGLTVGHEGRPVVEGIGISLPPGAVLAVVGTNGSGKSTLLRTLAGLLPPLAGTVEVVGGRPGSRPAHVAYLGQTHRGGFLLPVRARDVVRMGRFAGRGLLGRLTAADRACVEDGIERMGVGDVADRPLRDLSGGQRQRVLLAQALARRADVLLLDEPTTGLDAPARRLLDDALAAERVRGAAVVVATHDIRDAARADQALLVAGRVVAYGPPADALRPARLLETFGLTEADLRAGVPLMDPGHGHGHGHA